jgi:hypothetical protein
MAASLDPGSQIEDLGEAELDGIPCRLGFEGTRHRPFSIPLD